MFRRLFVFVILCVLAAGAGCTLNVPDRRNTPDGGMAAIDAGITDEPDGGLPRIDADEPSYHPGVEYVDGVVTVLAKALGPHAFATSPETVTEDAYEFAGGVVVDHALFTPPEGAIDQVILTPQEEFTGEKMFRLLCEWSYQVPYGLRRPFRESGRDEATSLDPHPVEYEVWGFDPHHHSGFYLLDRFEVEVRYDRRTPVGGVVWTLDADDYFVPQFQRYE